MASSADPQPPEKNARATAVNVKWLKLLLKIIIAKAILSSAATGLAGLDCPPPRQLGFLEWSRCENPLNRLPVRFLFTNWVSPTDWLRPWLEASAGAVSIAPVFWPPLPPRSAVPSVRGFAKIILEADLAAFTSSKMELQPVTAMAMLQGQSSRTLRQRSTPFMPGRLRSRKRIEAGDWT